METAPLSKALGALLLYLHLCGCQEYYDKERVFLYESTAPEAIPDEGLSFFQESPNLRAKRTTPSDDATAEDGSQSDFQWDRHSGDEVGRETRALDDNRIRTTSSVGYMRKSNGLPMPTTTAGWRETRRKVKKGQYGYFPKTPKVCAGEDIIFRAWGFVGELKNCTLVSPKSEFIQLYPPPTSKSNNSRITYYDYGAEGERCGFRISGVKFDEYGIWHLTVVTDKVNKSMEVGMGVSECPNNVSSAHYHYLPGERSSSQCGSPDVKSCYVESPDEFGGVSAPEKIQRDTCYTPAVPFSNLVAGEWKCDWTVEGSILQRSSKVDMEYAELPIDQYVALEWRNESSAGRKPSLDLHCNFRGVSPFVSQCRFVQPGGRIFYPFDGLAVGRYSYIGRGLGNGDCGLSLQQPLQPEDIGLWRCEIFLTTNDAWPTRGGYIEVGVAKRTREQKLQTLRAWGTNGRVSTSGAGNKGEGAVVEVMSGDPLVIGCSADAPLSLCLIRRPDGNATTPPTDKGAPFQAYGRGHLLGDCGVQVPAADVTNHTGRWECVVAIDYGDAHVVPIQVAVHERPMTAHLEGDIYRGQPANFSCKSVLGVSLEHCRFERPDRSIVSVMDSRHPEVHRASWRHGVRAVGDLGAGVCTVTIPALREEDFGEWTCVGKAQNSQSDFQLRFVVTEKGISAASVGAIVGVILAVALVSVAGAAVYFKRRGWRRRGAAARDLASQGAATDDSVISFRREDEEERISQSS